MTKQPNKFGGSSRTTANGLHFEQTTSLNKALEGAGYVVQNHTVYQNEKAIGRCVPQKRLYTYF